MGGAKVQGSEIDTGRSENAIFSFEAEVYEK